MICQNKTLNLENGIFLKLPTWQMEHLQDRLQLNLARMTHLCLYQIFALCIELLHLSKMCFSWTEGFMYVIGYVLYQRLAKCCIMLLRKKIHVFQKHTTIFFLLSITYWNNFGNASFKEVDVTVKLFYIFCIFFSIILSIVVAYSPKS